MELIIAVIVVPTIAAALSATLAIGWRRRVTVTATAITFASALSLAAQLLTSGSRRISFSWPGGVDAVLVADGLGVGLVLASATTALSVHLFALTQRDDPRGERPGYWPLSLALVAGVHGLVLAGDLFVAYVMLEVVAVTGASLVMLGGRRRERAAGARYFYAELMASISFLGGAALVWKVAGTVVIDALPADLVASSTGRWGLVLLTVGLLLKVPLVPLHFWMPAAHTLAPSTVSPLVSALVVKSAFVVLVRVWFVGLGDVATPSLDLLLGGLGALAILWGGLNALRSERLKQLVAYSTTAQLGLLFLLVPMAGAGSAEAWVGGVFHAIAHALPKAALLMAVAILVRSMGGDTVEHLAGAVTRRPLAVFTVGLSALSLIGLPPTGGFVAKWYLVVASIRTGQWWWAALVVLGSLLTAAYLARVVQACFAPGPTVMPGAAGRVRGRADVTAVTLASLSLLIGLYPDELVALVQVAAPIGGVGHG